MANAKPANAPPRSPRRWLRYSLRSFLLLVTAVCVLLGPAFNRARHERLAAEAVEAAGGKVVYDWQVAAHNDGVPPYPRWLRRLVGEHFFDRIVHVGVNRFYRPKMTTMAELGPRLERLGELRALTLWGRDLDAAGFDALGRLRQIEELSIRQDAPITDHGAAAIAGLTRLRELHLDNAILSSAGVAELAKLANLEKLRISCDEGFDPQAGHNYEKAKQNWLRDDAAEAIAGCTSLRELLLFRTLITDEGVAALCDLRNLETLVVSSPNITGAALHDVKRLKKLEWLGAWQWRIAHDELPLLGEIPKLTGVALYTDPQLTNENLPLLAELDQLETLRTNSGTITDEGLAALQSMTNLKHLGLPYSQVNKHGEAAKRLQAALPGCSIRLPKTPAERKRFNDWKWGGATPANDASQK